MTATDERTGASVVATAEPDLVRAQLERILAGSAFGHAESLIRLLRYLVEETLAGRSERLKEYTLGVEVFQRGVDFDPRIDTIVRTQVRRLRTKLQEYYSEQGRQDDTIIDLPRGTYVPTFARRPASAPLSSCDTHSSAAGLICVCGSESEPPPDRSRAIAVMGITVAAVVSIAAVLVERPPVSAVGRQSLAVLPFADFSPDGARTSLADGITEEISQALARLSGLRVASRTSTLQYKGRGENVRKIGADLGVTAVVEGSVRRLGDRIRITAHLVGTSDGYRLWSRTWEALPAEVERVQQGAAVDIARALGISTTLRESSERNPEAYRFYLKGRFGPQSPDSIAHLDRALAIDPGFAAAWLASAEYYMTVARRADEPPAAALPKAREAASKAIQLGGDVASAHLILANVAGMYDWDWDRAEKEFLRALDLDPEANWARLQYAHLLVNRGRTREAIDQIQRINALEPTASLLAAFQAAIYYFARQYDRATEQCRAVLEAAPDTPDCHYWMGRAFLSKGMTEEAVASFEKRQSRAPMGFGMPTAAYLAAGRRADALRLREQAERLAASRYISRVSLAQVYFAFGEKDAGFRELERALEMRDQSLPGLKAEPAYDAIRSDPRFQRILRKLRL